MMNKEQRYALNDGKEISLVPGLNEIRKKVIEPLQPDVVIVIDTHWFTIVEFIVSSHKRRKGFYTSDELPRTMDSIPFDIHGNPELANNIAECVSNNGVRCSSNNNEHLPIHYPTINMLPARCGHHINPAIAIDIASSTNGESTVVTSIYTVNVEASTAVQG